MNRTAPALKNYDVGRTSRYYEESQAVEQSTCCANEISQLLLEEKQAIPRREGDQKSKIQRGAIALNALVPINQLPDHVFRHIFKLLCGDSWPTTFALKCQAWGPKSPQITRSHICSTWREIILDVPTFWSSIKIVPRYSDAPQIFVSVVKVANTWLSRAKGLPCSIDIEFPVSDKSGGNGRSVWENDWHKNIIRDLISLHKFKKLVVTFTDHHLRDLLQLPDDNLSCVEDLYLQYVSPNEDDDASPLDLHKLSNLTSFSLLPNPFNLYTFSVPSRGYSKFAGTPWHNLRHIHLRVTMPTPFCLDALKHCSAVLETCSLVITDDHTFTSSPRVPVHLSQLRQLGVDVYPLVGDEEILESFLLSLRFPRLKSLKLGSFGYPAVPVISVDLQMLFRMQNASQMDLEELVISDSTISIDVRTLLLGFPTLRRLELPSKITFTDEAMNEVGAGSIGVFLEDLTINISDLDFEKLLQTVKARSRAGDGHRIEVNGFKHVTLYSTGPVEDDGPRLLDLIREIKQLGVNLEFNGVAVLL